MTKSKIMKEKSNSEDHNADYTLQGIMIRDKFLDLSQNLENDICLLVESKIKSWREENLPLEIGSVSQMSNSLSFGNQKKSPKTGELPSRVFVPRESLLNELFTISHIQSVYNIFVAILFILLLQEVCEEVMETGRVDLELSYMYWAFGKFDKVLILWLYMKISTMVGVYLCFHYWAHHRHKAPRVFDVIGLLLYSIYLSLFIYLPAKNVIINEFPPASSVAVLCEQVRLFMKTWAFVWSNIPRVLKFKKDDSSSETLCPNFSRYIFFLFVPTLVYRDEYPRNSTCNWKKVAKEFLQVIGCIFYTHFLLTRFCGPVFRKFGREKFSAAKLLKAVFSSCFPGFIVMLCGFFLVLHSWMNAFAEMLRFADRMFYKDWWNSTSYPRFYRTWNCIVHDWLYEYVYKALSDYQARQKGICSRLKFIPMFVVFFISSVVHEYILALSFKYFYPVLLIMFGGFGMFFMFIHTKATLFNIFIWVSLILGTGILMCMYTLEWYARINCPPVVEGIGDYFIPRSWFCYYQIGK